MITLFSFWVDGFRIYELCQQFQDLLFYCVLWASCESNTSLIPVRKTWCRYNALTLNKILLGGLCSWTDCSHSWCNLNCIYPGGLTPGQPGLLCLFSWFWFMSTICCHMRTTWIKQDHSPECVVRGWLEFGQLIHRKNKWREESSLSPFPLFAYIKLWLIMDPKLSSVPSKVLREQILASVYARQIVRDILSIPISVCSFGEIEAWNVEILKFSYF